MWVMTIDQQASRVRGDRVPELLDQLGDLTPSRHGGVMRGFERTVGDEVQALLDDAALVVSVSLRVLRIGGWSVGIGAGAVDRPIPDTTREASGPAFIHAREAVEAAKSRGRSAHIAVRGTDASAASDAEGVLAVLGAVVARRTRAGWEAIDALEDRTGGRAQEEVATVLGISQQAVSQRLRTALWSEEIAARPAAARLLRIAHGETATDSFPAERGAR